MEGHTPGPWKWGPNEYDNLEPDILGVAGAGYGDEHVVGSEADKALIAAAPDLLAACEVVLAGGFNETARISWAAPLVAQLQAAIAKAKGA